MTKKVFVYGTLRKHEKYHHILMESKLIAEQAWTRGRLFDSGNGYPVLIEDKAQFVYGELYSIDEDTFQRLDELEGYTGINKRNLYERKTDTVFTDFGKHEAIIYYVNQDSNLVQDPITLGDWKIHRVLNEVGSINYFAYGSCMDLERIIKARKDHLFTDVVGAGKLNGYKLRFTVRVSDGGRADIVEEDGLVEGKVYQLGKEAVEYLYVREGVHSGLYRPALVDIESNGKILSDALTFIVCDKTKEEAPPDHYINEIYRGGKNILSDKYIKELEEHVASLRM